MRSNQITSAATKALKLKAKELAQRLTGISIPIFGVSWTAPEPRGRSCAA
jgi:hypothetical protein